MLNFIIFQATMSYQSDILEGVLEVIFQWDRREAAKCTWLWVLAGWLYVHRSQQWGTRLTTHLHLMPSLPPLIPYAFMVWYLINLWPWLQIPFQIWCCRSLSLVWCHSSLPHIFCVVLSLTTTQTWYSGSISFSWNCHVNIKLRWHTVSKVLVQMFCLLIQFIPWHISLYETDWNATYISRWAVFFWLSIDI